MDFAWHGSLGEYGKIWKVIANLFSFFGGQLARAHDVLNRTEILVTDSVLMMMKYKDG